MCVLPAGGGGLGASTSSFFYYYLQEKTPCFRRGFGGAVLLCHRDLISHRDRLRELGELGLATRAALESLQHLVAHPVGVLEASLLHLVGEVLGHGVVQVVQVRIVVVRPQQVAAVAPDTERHARAPSRSSPFSW